jgi:hypothetical protein
LLGMGLDVLHYLGKDLLLHFLRILRWQVKGRHKFPREIGR